MAATTSTSDPSALDQTTLTTLSLLEARLLRIEHLLYGAAPPPQTTPDGSAPPSAVASLAQLERRFAALLGKFRVYAELLRIYNTHPLIFPNAPPTTASGVAASADTSTLPAAHHLATVLALAPTIAAVSSGLTAVFPTTSVVSASSGAPQPTTSTPGPPTGGAAASHASATSAHTVVRAADPIPPPRLSASLASLRPRLAAAAVVQRAQQAEIAALRARSEAVVRRFYQGDGKGAGGVLGTSRWIGDVQGRVERAERVVRRKEREKDEVL